MLFLISFLFPIVAGILVSAVKLTDEKLRNRLYAGTILIADLICILAICFGRPITLFSFAEHVTMAFALDGFGKLVLIFVMLLFTCVLFYAFEYMKMEERVPVFFAFYFVGFGAMIAVCTAANLVTLYFCFELATLSTVPLVLHEMSKDAVAAGLKYLFYSIAGALMGLLAVFFVYYYGKADADFVYGGFLDLVKVAGHEGVLLAVIFVGILGFGTKAGMYPMHGWLPTAHPIAPAPASALLSGIIAKAGVVAIVRLVYYSVGADFLRGTWVQYAWMILCLLTIFMGSMMAFREKITKKRLAYSTVSQISYILLGLSMLSKEGLEGGILHLMSHAASKGCLFLVAGIFIYKLNRRKVTELRGVGRLMPVTMWCFMIASLSLVGIPPMGGFLSKWVLAKAALGDGMGILSILPPVILLISALLTAGYLFPVAIDGFFPGEAWKSDVTEVRGSYQKKIGDTILKCEPPLTMTIPLMVLCAAALGVGIFGVQILGVFGL